MAKKFSLNEKLSFVSNFIIKPKSRSGKPKHLSSKNGFILEN
ncbi:11236_t:CDS:2 [Funneliformis geosporum]|uniref:2179_t:CDS:1 n=1 Tax=Funneliformis geosporum TaxID=1117311 RepID=A0A9W4SXH6_9GLOM|nr:11236_t:CDS:2 [Funneliformis geosporum]CAI2184497.1 2179_t:CDS:2 [Funneliformis geosporum]